MAFGYKPKRTRNLFRPGNAKPFRLSRLKIENFLNCPRCFYLDRRLGIQTPPPPPYSLNSAVDSLLKAEFDQYRDKQEKPPLLSAFEVEAIPFQHPEMDTWRDALHGGVRYHHPESNFLVSGAIDDLWIDQAGKLLVVDYKSTSRKQAIGPNHLWPYRRQVEIYQWLLRKNGFPVHDTAYFVYCNGNSQKASFRGRLEFDVCVLPLKGNSRWVDAALLKIKSCLEASHPPQSHPDCAFCQYRTTIEECLRDQPIAPQENLSLLPESLAPPN